MRVQLNMPAQLIQDVLFARIVTVLFTFFEWILLYVCGPFLLRESREPRKLILRPLAAIFAIAIVALQAHIYWAFVSRQDQGNRNFITLVWFLQHLVGLFLLLRAAFKARRTAPPKTG